MVVAALGWVQSQQGSPPVRGCARVFAVPNARFFLWKVEVRVEEVRIFAGAEVMAGAGVMVAAKGMGRRGCSRAAQAKETAGAATALVRAPHWEVERGVAGY